MLDQLDLVHMNGRIYDPLMARFLSADPMIQDPAHSQSYNRYTYVWNNPTNLTDPTGFEAGNAGDNGLIQKEEANKKDCDLACQDLRRMMDVCREGDGSQWKRWPDKRSWEKGETPNSIWPDGRIRK